jgi:hypothetical protein
LKAKAGKAMKKMLLVFTSLLVVSGIVSAILWRDLQTERHTNAELRLQLAKSGSVSSASATPATTAELAQQVATPQPAAISEAPVAEAKPTPALVESEVFMSAMSAAILGRATAVAGISERDLLKDPEYREAQLTQARLRLAVSNPGLVETLGLSRTEADHLFDVMAETQLKLTVEFTGMGANAAGTPPSAAAMREMVSGREDPARAVLGEARYAQYQEYVRNAKPVLSRVSSLGYVLNSASQPLNDSQARALAAAVLAERQRQEAAAASRPNPNPASWNAADAMAEHRQAEEESRRRVIAAVSPQLDSAQIDVLQKEHEQQIAFARQSDARLQATPLPARGGQP